MLAGGLGLGLGLPGVTGPATQLRRVPSSKLSTCPTTTTPEAGRANAADAIRPPNVRTHERRMLCMLSSLPGTSHVTPNTRTLRTRPARISGAEAEARRMIMTDVRAGGQSFGGR